MSRRSVATISGIFGGFLITFGVLAGADAAAIGPFDGAAERVLALVIGERLAGPPPLAIGLFVAPTPTATPTPGPTATATTVPDPVPESHEVYQPVIGVSVEAGAW